MKTLLVAVILSLGALLLWMARPAHAGMSNLMAVMPCNDTAIVLKTLTQNYQEVVIAGGVDKDFNQIRVFQSVPGNTWTIILTTPVGITCVLKGGTDWQADPAIIQGHDT